MCIRDSINLTPDSFSDGGKYNKKNKAYNYAKELVKKGCAILDIGGESTRPGSKEVKNNVVTLKNRIKDTKIEMINIHYKPDKLSKFKI